MLYRKVVFSSFCVFCEFRVLKELRVSFVYIRGQIVIVIVIVIVIYLCVFVFSI
jgi:hypothetical protein